MEYDTGYNAAAPFGWRSKYYPRWLPDGYQVDSVEYSSEGDYVWYTSPNGDKISFFVKNADYKLGINTETRERTDVTIDGHRAILYSSLVDDSALLLIPLEDCTIQIEGSLPKDTICQIAESVNYY